MRAKFTYAFAIVTLAAAPALAQGPAPPGSVGAAPRASAAVSAAPTPAASSSTAPRAAAADPHGGVDPHAGIDPHADPHGGGDDPHADPHGGDPHGRAAAPGQDMLQDTTEESKELRPGTIEVTLRNETDAPLAGALVTLGILHNTVAKGESREKVSRVTDAQGRILFEHLETGSAVAYRVSTAREGATFAATPFRLGPAMGSKVVLHSYPVTSDVDRTLVVGQAIVFAELKEDRIQVQQAFTVFNFGKTAWVPKDLVLALPEGYTALTSSQEMSDIVIEPVEKRGAAIRGTFGPGRHDFEMKWQLPYSGDKSVTLDAPVPPHMAAARVIVPAAQSMQVDATGFPKPQSRVDASGQRVLITEKQLTRDEPALKTVRIELSNLPTPGPARYLVTLLAGVGITLGIALLVLGRTGGDHGRSRERQNQVLADLEDLERAYLAGDVGPKTYERERRLLIDRLAEIVAASIPPASSRA